MMNNRYDVFLSVIYVLNDDLDRLKKTLTTTVQTLSQIVTDYEIVVVDNMSDKSKSISLLKELTNDKNFKVHGNISHIDRQKKLIKNLSKIVYKI